MLYDLIRTLEGPLANSQCPLNTKDKSFLWFRWKVTLPHFWEITDIGKFMPGISTDFTVVGKCKICGKWNKASFVSHESLIKLGYTPEQLDNASHNRI